MKLFIFRCRARRQLYGATRFETGSNLPADRCTGGWEFEQFVDLAAPGAPRTGVDLRMLRRNIQDQGWHVWEDTRPDSRQPAAPEPPPPPPPEIKPPPPSVPPLLELDEAPDIPVLPPPPPEIVRTPAPPAPPPAQIVAPPPRTTPSPAVIRAPAADSKAPPRSAAPAERRRTASRDTVPAPRPAASPPAADVPAAPPARHQVVWFDIPVRDLDRALVFYSAVLGTPLSKAQAGPGVAMAVLPHTEGSIGGCLVQSLDAKPSDGGPLLYLNTQGRLDEAVSVVESHGGKVVHPRHSIGPFGFRAIVLDSEGNRIALHSM